MSVIKQEMQMRDPGFVKKQEKSEGMEEFMEGRYRRRALVGNKANISEKQKK